jgi:hypothetical protein
MSFSHLYSGYLSTMDVQFVKCMNEQLNGLRTYCQFVLNNGYPKLNKTWHLFPKVLIFELDIELLTSWYNGYFNRNSVQSRHKLGNLSFALQRREGLSWVLILERGKTKTGVGKGEERRNGVRTRASLRAVEVAHWDWNMEPMES